MIWRVQASYLVRHGVTNADAAAGVGSTNPIVCTIRYLPGSL